MTASQRVWVDVGRVQWGANNGGFKRRGPRTSVLGCTCIDGVDVNKKQVQKIDSLLVVGF